MAILTEQGLSIKSLAYGFRGTFLRAVGSLERAITHHIARMGSQLQRTIWLSFPLTELTIFKQGWENSRQLCKPETLSTEGLHNFNDSQKYTRI